MLKFLIFLIAVPHVRTSQWIFRQLFYRESSDSYIFNFFVFLLNKARRIWRHSGICKSRTLVYNLLSAGTNVSCPWCCIQKDLPMLSLIRAGNHHFSWSFALLSHKEPQAQHLFWVLETYAQKIANNVEWHCKRPPNSQSFYYLLNIKLHIPPPPPFILRFFSCLFKISSRLWVVYRLYTMDAGPGSPLSLATWRQREVKTTCRDKLWKLKPAVPEGEK